MGGRLTLRRPLETVIIRFAGDVAQRRLRRDLLVVVMTIIEHAGEVTLAEVSDHLFGGRQGFAHGLLLDAQRHGLVELLDEDRFTVTDAGLEALRSGMVFEERFETWELTVADDPLLSETIVLLLEVAKAPRLYDVTHGDEREAAADLPAGAMRHFGVPIEPLAQAGSRFVTPALDEADCFCFRGPSKYWLECEIDDGGQVGISDSQSRYSIDLQRDLEFERALAVVPGAFWDRRSDVLRAPATSLTDEHLQRRAITGSFPDVEVGAAGTFVLAMQGLPVAPCDAEDARLWAVRRLAASPPRPATADAWKARLSDEATELGMRSVKVPRAEVVEHLEETGRDGTSEWRHIRAALDWEL